MDAKFFPRLQIALLLIFSAGSIFGPLAWRDVRTLLIFLVGIGGLVGCVTIAIGFRVLVSQQPVIYPLTAAAAQASLAAEGQLACGPDALSTAFAAGQPAPRGLGIASLVAGLLLVVAMLAAGTVVFPA